MSSTQSGATPAAGDGSTMIDPKKSLLAILSAGELPHVPKGGLSMMTESLHDLILVDDASVGHFFQQSGAKIKALRKFEDGFLEVINDLPDDVAQACANFLEVGCGPRGLYLVFPLPPSNSEDGNAEYPFCIECPAEARTLIPDLADVFSENKGAADDTGLRRYFGGVHDASVSQLSKDIKSIQTMFTELPAERPTDLETLANLRASTKDWKHAKSNFDNFENPAVVLVVKDTSNPENNLKTFFKPGGVDEMTGYCLDLASDDVEADSTHGMVLLEELSLPAGSTWSNAQSDLKDSLTVTKASIAALR